jgi:2'-5' RNA ligase
VPAHITLLVPFAPAPHVDPQVISSLAELVGAVPAFAFDLRGAERFPGVLYLAPEPASTFARLTEAIVTRFPDYPPYGGAFETVVPHLTVAEGDDVVLDEVEAAVERFLPIRAVAREAVLLEEVEPDWRAWHVRARIPLGKLSRAWRTPPSAAADRVRARPCRSP